LISINSEPIRASGKVSFYEYDGWGIYNNYSVPSASYLSTGAATTNLAARTNPNRAGINLPVSVAELRELPLLVRGIGRHILGIGDKSDFGVRLASANLTGQFGLAPIISDVMKLMDFQNSVKKRISELEQLRSQGGIRRRRDITDSSTQTVVGQFQRGTGLASVLTRETVTQSVKQWGTIRFNPGSLTKDPRTNFDELGRNLFLGLTKGQVSKQVWEGLPWSWLIDWYTNIGDLIGSNGGTVSYIASSSIMTHRKAVRKIEVLSHSSGLKVTPMSTTVTYERKSRLPGSLVPSFNSGGLNLSPSQASILGSLAVLRGRPRLRG
jgi:hypothetical protein